jgi:hypothetical protein
VAVATPPPEAELPGVAVASALVALDNAVLDNAALITPPAVGAEAAPEGPALGPGSTAVGVAVGTPLLDGAPVGAKPRVSFVQAAAEANIPIRAMECFMVTTYSNHPRKRSP